MVYHRITITPMGPMSTAWISGTVWGHMAWAIRYVEGEQAFAAWMAEQETSPWLFSSQMPENMLPKPLLKPAERESEKPSLEKFDSIKKIRKLRYIPEALFLSLKDRMIEKLLRKGLEAHSGGGPPVLKPVHFFHNRIDRQTGRTPQSGGLFVENAKWAGKDRSFQIFAATGQNCGDRLHRLLEFISRSGFGANASTGRGAFRFAIQEETQLFAGAGARAMSLSHGIITPEMRNPRYQQHTHFGKLGGHFAAGAYSPFKYPILMAQPGATFDPAGKAPFGRLLAEVHHDPALAAIRHHAFHLPIYFTEVSP